MLRALVLAACVMAATASVDARLQQLQKALQQHGADSPQALTAVRLYKEERAKAARVAAAAVEKPEVINNADAHEDGHNAVPPASHPAGAVSLAAQDPLATLQKVLDKYGADSAAAQDALKQ